MILWTVGIRLRLILSLNIEAVNPKLDIGSWFFAEY